jgi:hypothetical protein
MPPTPVLSFLGMDSARHSEIRRSCLGSAMALGRLPRFCGARGRCVDRFKACTNSAVREGVRCASTDGSGKERREMRGTRVRDKAESSEASFKEEPAARHFAGASQIEDRTAGCPDDYPGEIGTLSTHSLSDVHPYRDTHSLAYLRHTRRKQMDLATLIVMKCDMLSCRSLTGC